LRNQMVIKQRQRKTSMNGLLGTFFLKNFNEFLTITSQQMS